MKLSDFNQALSTFDEAITAQPYLGLAYYYKALALKDIGLQTHDIRDIRVALETANKAFSLYLPPNSDNKIKNLKISLVDILAWNQGQLK